MGTVLCWHFELTMAMSSELQPLIIHHYQSDSEQNSQELFKVAKHIPSVEFICFKLKPFPDTLLEHHEVECIAFYDCKFVTVNLRTSKSYSSVSLLSATLALLGAGLGLLALIGQQCFLGPI